MHILHETRSIKNLNLPRNMMLVNPMLGLQPKYTEEDFEVRFTSRRRDAEPHRRTQKQPGPHPTGSSRRDRRLAADDHLTRAWRYNPSIFLAHKIAARFGLTIEEVFIFEEEE